MILSNSLFVINLFVDIGLEVGNITLILWILAFLLFVTEVFVTLSIERSEFNVQNFFTVILMYFTYSQLWIVLVIYSLYLETKRVLFNQEVKWYKTDRFD